MRQSHFLGRSRQWCSVSVAFSLCACHAMAAQSRLITTQIPATNAPPFGLSGIAVDAGSPLPPGSRIVSFDPSEPGAAPAVLTGGFAAAGRPNLSFDAKNILFVGRRAADEPLNVWQMNTDGTSPRQLTKFAFDCTAAIYLSTVYTIDADRPSRRIAFASRSAADQASSLYTCRTDGSGVRRITFSPSDVSDPLILGDGRLVFGLLRGGGEAAEAVRSPCGVALFTVHADGTDLFPFAAVHEPAALRGMPCETEDGSIVYVESHTSSRDAGGSLVAVARTRSLHTRRVIVNDDDGTYYSPSSWPGGKLLVSYKPRGGGSYGLYLLDPETGTRHSKLLDRPDWHEVFAVALAPRPEPAGRSSVVKAEGDIGQIYCLDSSISDAPNPARIARERIKRVRVFQARLGGRQNLDGLKPGGRDSTNAPHVVTEGELLGEVAVEADGSIFVEVPARTPLRLETVDQAGQVLTAMRSWFWVMPGERRGCIGCHEDRELTPPNRHVLALRKAPSKLGAFDRNDSPRSAPQGPYGDK